MNDPRAETATFVFEDEQPKRLDKFLVACLPDLSRARIQKLIKDGMVIVDGQQPNKAGYKLEREASVQIHIPPPEPTDLVPETIPLDIVFENEDTIVVNKPAGMVVHPSAGHTSGTLVHAALAHAPEMEGIGGEMRPGVVHRLDKNTSGLILLAKNDRSHRWLQDQFRLRLVTKTYIALVDGRPPTPTGRIEAPIGRDPRLRKKMAVTSDRKGRQAVSKYSTLESFDRHTLLEIQPVTGRTHQIRLHLDFIGCPVVGDVVYGLRRPSIPLKRHFLHAARLRITLLGENHAREFSAPLPPELEKALEKIRHHAELLNKNLPS